ncbi:MAG TPA: FecR domain-containing protein [Planctomycetota bacterium]|nr:FecR domain-containing protein [Planctomycetota bacterium]
MNREDELTLKLLDGLLTPEEEAELEALVERDPHARRRHLALLDLEAALRGDRLRHDMVPSVLTRVSGADLEKAVMRTIAGLPAPPWRAAAPTRAPLPRRRTRIIALTAILSAAAVLLVALVLANPAPRKPAASPSTAVLLPLEGDILLDARRSPPETRLSPGQTVQVPEDGAALVSFEDGTQLELLGQSTLRMDSGPSDEVRIHLPEGVLRAEVAPRPDRLPLSVITPYAVVTVVGTSFSVITLPDRGTRIEVFHGKVEVNAAPQGPITLEAGWMAFSAPNQPVLTARSRVVEGLRPRRSAEYPGVKTLDIAPDGRSVLAASNTHLVTWTPLDRLDVVRVDPSTPRANDIQIQSQSGRMLGFIHWPQKRFVAWDAWDRKAVRSWPMLDGQAEIAAVSPRGDWLAHWQKSNGSRKLLLRSGTEEPLDLSRGSGVSVMQPSPDGSRLALARFTGVVELVDPAAGTVVATLPGSRKAIRLSFSADGRFLATSQGEYAEIWNVAERRLTARFQQPGLPILGVALTPDGGRFAASGPEGRVWLWNPHAPQDPPWVLPVKDSVQRLFFTSGGAELMLLRRAGRTRVLEAWELPP